MPVDHDLLLNLINIITERGSCQIVDRMMKAGLDYERGHERERERGDTKSAKVGWMGEDLYQMNRGHACGVVKRALADLTNLQGYGIKAPFMWV